LNPHPFGRRPKRRAYANSATSPWYNPVYYNRKTSIEKCLFLVKIWGVLTCRLFFYDFLSHVRMVSHNNPGNLVIAAAEYYITNQQNPGDDQKNYGPNKPADLMTIF
jgi:hypothetical protein